jgi:hypothetical protein
MSVWPTIAASGITGATAVIGYFFGDHSSKRSTAATVKQIESENERVIQQITAENERLREQHREDHLRNRQNTYHAFMNYDQLMSSMFAYGTEGVVREEYDRMSVEFLNLLNGVAAVRHGPRDSCGAQPQLCPLRHLPDVHGRSD